MTTIFDFQLTGLNSQKLLVYFRILMIMKLWGLSRFFGHELDIIETQSMMPPSSITSVRYLNFENERQRFWVAERGHLCGSAQVILLSNNIKYIQATEHLRYELETIFCTAILNVDKQWMCVQSTFMYAKLYNVTLYFLILSSIKHWSILSETSKQSFLSHSFPSSRISN